MIKNCLIALSLVSSTRASAFICHTTSDNVTDKWCQSSCAYPNIICSQHCTCGKLSSKCKPIPEKFIQGVKLDHSPVQTAQECCDFCISVPGCTAWVLDQGGCTAKNQTTSMIYTAGVISGTLELCGIGSNPFPISLNYQICPHMKATPQGGASVYACSSYCCATDTCRSWQYLSTSPNTTACQTSPYRFTSCASTNVAWLGRSQNFPSPSPPPFPSPSPGKCGHNTSVIFPIDLENSTCLGMMRSPDGDESAFACYKACCAVHLCNTWQYQAGKCWMDEDFFPNGCTILSPGGVGGSRLGPRSHTPSPAPARTVPSYPPTSSKPEVVLPWWYFAVGGGAAALPIALAIVVVAFKCCGRTDNRPNLKSTNEMMSPLIRDQTRSRSLTYGFNIPMDQLSLGRVLATLGAGKIRRGAFAGQQVALKKVSRIKASNEDLWGQHMTEASLLCSLHHPHIVRFYGIAKNTSSTGKWVDYYLVMDYKSNDLGRLLLSGAEDAASTRSEVLRMARETSSALEYLHSINMVHRDFSVESILLDEKKNVFVCNFGISKTRPGPETQYSIYTPPEVRLRTHQMDPIDSASTVVPRGESMTDVDLDLDAKGDCYAFAMVLWALMAWRHPRSLGSSASALIHWRPPAISIESTWPSSLICLMKTLWDPNPSVRPTMKEAAVVIQTQVGKALFRQYFNTRVSSEDHSKSHFPERDDSASDLSDFGGNFSECEMPMASKTTAMSVVSEMNNKGRDHDHTSASDEELEPPMKLSSSTLSLTRILNASMTPISPTASESDSSHAINVTASDSAPE